MYGCIPSTGETDRNMPRAHWKARPAYPGCARTSEKPCLRKQGEYCLRDNTQDWPLASTCVCPHGRTMSSSAPEDGIGLEVSGVDKKIFPKRHWDPLHGKGHSKSENPGEHSSGELGEPIVWGWESGIRDLAVWLSPSSIAFLLSLCRTGESTQPLGLAGTENSVKVLPTPAPGLSSTPLPLASSVVIINNEVFSVWMWGRQGREWPGFPVGAVVRRHQVGGSSTSPPKALAKGRRKATHQSIVTASSLLFKEREHRIKAMEKTEVELLSFWLCSLADPLEGRCVD